MLMNILSLPSSVALAVLKSALSAAVRVFTTNAGDGLG
jgi:hypothetical protein